MDDPARPADTKPGAAGLRREQEQKTIHCSRLGGTVTLGYCMSPAQDAPCERIRDCWWQFLDIDRYLAECLGREGLLELINKPRRDRLGIILDVLKELGVSR